MKQTREAVCAVEQSILLRCLWQNHSEVDLIKLFGVNLLTFGRLDLFGALREISSIAK